MYGGMGAGPLTQSVYIQDVLQGLGSDEDGDGVELGGLQPAHRVGRHVQDAVLTLLLTHTHTHTHTHTEHRHHVIPDTDACVCVCREGRDSIVAMVFESQQKGSGFQPQYPVSL